MRITKIVLASAIVLMATAVVRADGPSASPALPLPDVSSTWNTATPAGVVSTSYNANYDSQQPTTVAANGTQVGPPAPVSDEPAPTVASMPSCQTQPSSGCQGGCGGGEGCCGGGCSPFGGRGYGAGCDCCCNPWYGYAGGLVMGRNQANKYWTTYNELNNADQVLNTDNASAHWGGGGEFTIGRCLGCDNRIEATYWGIWNMNGSASISDPTNHLGTPMDTTNGGVMIGTQTADSFFTHADQVLLRRNDQVNNVEINFCYNPNGADVGCGMTSTWVAGFRYFRFDEDLLWTSVAANDFLGEAGGADQANLEIRAKNDLAGFQVGNCLNWKFCNRASVYLGTKVGVYGNDAQTTSSLYSGSGVSGFVYHGQKDDVAFIGQADLGLNYDIGCRWSATVGYRAVFATGIALADEQIPFYLAGQSDFQDVKTNGDLVLTGGFAGISFCW